MFAFKCAGQRVCDAWVGGGPITEEKDLYEAMASWNEQPITGVQLDRRYNRPMVTKSEQNNYICKIVYPKETSRMFVFIYNE